MLISSREAAALLAPLGLSRESVRRILAFGLAGPAHETRAARLHERERVLDLLRWPPVDLGALDPHAVGPGVFVVRLGNHYGTFEEAASGPWRISPWLRVRMAVIMERRGHVPLVATVGGYVVLGRNIVGGTVHPKGESTIGRQPGRTCTFELSEPGPWFAAFEGHRWALGPGSAWRWWQLSTLPALQE